MIFKLDKHILCHFALYNVYLFLRIRLAEMHLKFLMIKQWSDIILYYNDIIQSTLWQKFFTKVRT